MLFLYVGHLAADISSFQKPQENRCTNTGNNIKPGLLKQLFFLDNRDREFIASPAHGVLDLHHEVIGSAGKICIRHRIQFTAPDGHSLPVKAFQTVGHLGIRQQIVVDKAIDRQLLDIRGNRKAACLIGIQTFAVCFNIGYSLFEVADNLQRSFDIDLSHAGTACNVQITFRCQFTVGVAGSNMGQTVCNPVVNGVNLLVLQQFCRRNNIDPVAAEDPHIPLAVAVEVEIIGIGEVLYGGHPVVLGHPREGVTGHDPEDMVIAIVFDPHDDP